MFSYTVNTKINAEIDLLFRTLLDIPGYKTWWIPTPTINKDRLSFHFFPLPFIKIKIRYENHEWGKSVSYSYVKGPFRGKAAWHVSEEQDSGMLTLAYSVNLVAINPIFEKISQSRLFRRKHANDILRLVKSMGKEICRRKSG